MTARRRIHVALSTDDLARSITDYTKRLGEEPTVVVPDAYALWRTEHVNLSVRVDDSIPAGALRHLGWELDAAAEFLAEEDVNGVIWESFDSRLQDEEIRQVWPSAFGASMDAKSGPTSP